LCHNATILRGGRVTGECKPAEESAQSIARMMVGEDTPISTTYEKRQGGEDFLVVSGLSLDSQDPFGTRLKNINLRVRKGEIVGIAGVAGNGQDELLAALSGERLAREAGQIRVPAGRIALLPPLQRRNQGLAFVPEERLGRGAVPDMSLEETGLLTAFGAGLVKNGFVNWGKTRAFARSIVDDFKVKCAGTGATAQSLSGGNLQKFIIGREIRQNPSLLLAAHPTWGVDIGAAVAIHKALIELRDTGTAILIVSEDIDELFQISDRICAICHGELSPLKAVRDTSIDEVGQWMAGHFDSEAERENTHAQG
jgi:simple sugar transport system ATP-binding protein